MAIETLPDDERERQHEVARQQRLAYKEKPRSRAGAILLGLLIFFILGSAGAVWLLRHASDDN